MVRPVTSARLVTALVQEAHAGEPAAFGDAAIPPTIAILSSEARIGIDGT